MCQDILLEARSRGANCMFAMQRICFLSFLSDLFNNVMDILGKAFNHTEFTPPRRSRENSPFRVAIYDLRFRVYLERGTNDARIRAVWPLHKLPLHKLRKGGERSWKNAGVNC